MNKLSRRVFFKTTSLTALALLGTKTFGAIKSKTAGIDAVRKARGNLASKIQTIDGFTKVPEDANQLESYMFALNSADIQNAVFANKTSTMPANFSIEDAKKLNKFNFELTKKYADKTKCTGLISISELEFAMLEAETCVNKYGFAAIEISASDIISDKGNLAPILEKIAQLNVPLIVQCAYSVTNDIEKDSAIGSAAYKLLSMQLPKDLKIIISRMGGTLAWSLACQNLTIKDNPNFYFIVGNKIAPSTLEVLKASFGSERFLFGSAEIQDKKQALKNVEVLSLSEDDFNASCFGNAIDLFGFNPEK